MGIFSDLFTRYKKQIETSDNHRDEALQTHYYKGTFNQVFHSVEEYFKADADCHVATVSKDHGEIAVEINKPVPCFLVVTILAVRGNETAVDFNISTESFSVTGSYPLLKKRIISFYERLNQLHTLVKTGKN